MPLLLRKIRRSRWYTYPHIPWLTESSLQADAFIDLKTIDNKLSVWQIDDDKSNLEQVVTALATNFDSSSNLDFALIDRELVSKIGIRIQGTKGDTKYEQANINWHSELVQLSAQKLMELAEMVMRYATKERITERQVLSLIRQAVESSTIDRVKLKPNLQKKVGGLPT